MGHFCGFPGVRGGVVVSKKSSREVSCFEGDGGEGVEVMVSFR